MKRCLSILALAIALLSPSFAADQADLVFAAVTAKNDKEASRLLQDLALTRNFTQFDKVQARDPGLFDAKHFPGDFVSKIIFNYVENAAAASRSAQKAAGTNNPNAKGTWQWYLWDLDKALASRQATKDATLQKTLSAQIDADAAALQKALAGYLDSDAQMRILLYLYSVNEGLVIPGAASGSSDPEASAAERLNAQFGPEAAAILEYLFKAGVPFPEKLPASLKLEAWKREKAAFDAFVTITIPDKQSEFETKIEFGQRNAEWKRLDDLVASTELSLPATLALGTYNAEGGGYFPLTIALPAIDGKGRDGERTQLVAVRDLAKADLRYYLDRKNAPFFKDKGFAAWTATATIAARSPAVYGLKELVVKNGKDVVKEGFWGFRVRKTRGASGETVMSVENYVKGREYDFSGTKVTGFGASIPIAADGSFVLAGSAGGPSALWKGDLTAVWEPQIGDKGLAGGIVFYDKGEFSDGWRYLEAAPNDQSTGIQWWNGSGIDIKTGTAVGTGKANTEFIIVAQGSGNFAATICKNLSINGFSDWFLPSMDELELVNTNLVKPGLGGFTEARYWSSSQNSKDHAIYLDTYFGMNTTSKYITYPVRAVRVF